MDVTAMAAVFTEIRLEEMEQYLKRAFRVLRPQTKVGFQNQIVIDLSLSENVIIRVFSSIFRGHETVRSVGTDTIKIGLCSAKSGRSLKSGDMPYIKRTQGWRDSLRKRIEDEMEDYDDREGYWESRATGVPTPHGT